MYQSSTDPYEAIMRQGGYSEAVLKRQREKERQRAAEAKRIEEMDRADKMRRDFQTQALKAMRTRLVPGWASQIITDAARRHGVQLFDVVARSVRKEVVAARHEAMYLIKAAKPVLSCPMIGSWFGRDHTSVLYAITKYAIDNGLPKFSKYRIAAERRRSVSQASAARRDAEKRAAK